MKVRVTGESVRSSQEAVWDIDDLEIEVCKVKQPPSLAAVQVLGLTEVCQVLMICKNLNGKRGAMKIVPPGLQSVDDREELPVIDVVVTLSRNEQLGKVGTGVPVAV